MNKTQKAMAATDEAVPAPVEDKAKEYRPKNQPLEAGARAGRITGGPISEEIEFQSPTGGVQKFFNREDVRRMQQFEQDFSAFLTALNDIELLLTNRLSEVQDIQKTLKVFQR